ncbi:MAG: hypothetical protein PVI86_17505 [Phycisphaerae bacterium]|jgi:hypothetical protein
MSKTRPTNKRTAKHRANGSRPARRRVGMNRTADKPVAKTGSAKEGTARKPISPRKLRANRANAQKSTGPRTPQGKLKSSRNAVKHGIFANDVVIAPAHERPEQFRALLHKLTHQFKPKTAMDRALVERVATCFWRLRRAQRFEVGAIRAALDESSRTDTELPETLGKLKARLNRATARLHARRHDLESIRKLTALDDPDQAAKVQPHLVEIANEVSPLAAGLPTPKLHRFLSAKLAQHIEHLEAEVPRLSAQIKDLTDREQQRLDRSHQTGSLPAPQHVLTLVRYENMLDRHLHRALTQLSRRRPANDPTDPRPHRPRKRKQ